MNTAESLNGKTPNRCLKHLVALKPVKRLLAVLAGAFVALCATLSAHAAPLESNAFTLVSDITTKLLSAPLTPEQRQMLHAQNFNQLPPSARPYYLHAVAYAAGLAVASDGFRQEQGMMLRQHLESVSSIYGAPAIPPEYSQLVAARMVVVNMVLQELNVRISGEVANNPSLQQAMDAGAVDTFWSWDWWD